MSVGLSLALATPAVAAPPAVDPAPAEAAPAEAAPAEPKNDLDEARQLYQKGRARYDTFDYDGAIQYWTDALAVLPTDDTTRSIRNDIVWNLAKAQVEAYKQDEKRIRLLRSQELLKVYLDEYERLYGEEVKTSEEAQRVQKQLAEIEAMLAAHDETAKPVPQAVDPEPQPSQPAERPLDPSARKLTIAGAVLLGVGALSLTTMAIGLGRGAANQREGENATADDTSASELGQIERVGRTMNVMAIVGGAAGGALVVAGAVMLGVGQARKSKRAAMVPVIGPQMVGATWKVSF